MPSAPLEQCHILCDNPQPDFTTLSSHRCHFCPSSAAGPRGTLLTVPSQQPCSLLPVFPQLHASGACTASRITTGGFAERSSPKPWLQRAACSKAAVCTRTAGLLTSPLGTLLPVHTTCTHLLLTHQVLCAVLSLLKILVEPPFSTTPAPPAPWIPPDQSSLLTQGSSPRITVPLCPQ